MFWFCAVTPYFAIGTFADSVVAVLALFLVFSFFNAGYNTLTGIYPSEVFPTEVRSIGTGFAAAVSRVEAGLGTFLPPWSMIHIGRLGNHADRRRHRWPGRCVVAVARARDETQEPFGDGRWV